MRTLMRLLASVILCLPFSVFGQDFDNEYADVGGSEFKRKGYQFVNAEKGEGFDTAVVQDPITGDVILKRRPRGPVPATMNGKKIYKLTEVTTPPQTIITAQPLEEYLLDNLMGSFVNYWTDTFTIKLELRNVIIDETGKVVYYDFGQVKGWGPDETTRTLNRGDLSDKVESLMSKAPLMKPATYNGKAVPAYTGVTLEYYEIDIRKPNVTYRKTKNKYHGKNPYVTIK